MRGIPKNVWSDDDRIMVDMGQLRMPLPKKECMRLFKREPKNELEARKFALMLKKGRKEVIFDNITTKNDRKKSKRSERLERKKMRESGLVKVELNNVLMIDGKEPPSMKLFTSLLINLLSFSAPRPGYPPYPGNAAPGRLPIRGGWKTTQSQNPSDPRLSFRIRNSAVLFRIT